MMNLSRYLLLLLLFLGVFGFMAHEAKASHAMAADLSYEHLGGGVYRFTVTFYRDCYGISAPSSMYLTIQSTTCGVNTSITLTQGLGPSGQPSGTEVSQLCAAQLPNSTCNGGSLPGTQVYYYTGTYTIACAAADWRFSTAECCRNSAVTNLNGAAGYDLYVEASLNNTLGNNSSPVFSNQPVPYLCAGQPVVYSNSATEPDGDVLVYSLIQPRDNATTPVPYAGTYSSTYPVYTTPAASFGFNTTTGEMNFTPQTGTNQVCVVSVLVQEYRGGVLIGSTMRDIQLIVQTGCTNQAPTSSGVTGVGGGTVTGPDYITACAGSTVSFTYPATDANGDNITMSITGLGSLPGTPSFTITNNNSPSPTGTFNWNIPPGTNGLFVVNISVLDNGCTISGQNVYAVAIDITGLQVSVTNPVICGQPVNVLASGGSNFTWSPMTGVTCNTGNCSNVSLLPAVPTTYTVTNSCGEQAFVNATLAPSYNLDLTQSTANLCNGASGQLLAEPDVVDVYSYSWSPAATLNNPSIQAPVATPTVTTTYTVVVTSSSGCIRTDSVTVVVTPVGAPVVTATATPNVICIGGSTNLLASVSAATCSTPYTVNSIAYQNVGAGGGWTNAGLNTNEEMTGAINLGFTFGYFCNTYTQCYLSSNGYLIFGAATQSPTAQTMPNAATPNNVVALCWGNLFPNANNMVRYKTVGTAPNRRFIVRYQNTPHATATGTMTGFIVLYETTNVIEIHLNSQNYSSGNYTCGIEFTNASGTVATVPPGRNNSAWSLSASEAWRFTPASSGPYSYAWTSSPPGFTSSIFNPSASPTVTTDYAVEVTDLSTGCATTRVVNVGVRSVDAGPDQTICAGGYANLAATLIGPAGGATTCGAAPGPCSGASSPYTVGTGLSTVSYPFLNFWHDGRTQMLFTAAELTAAGISPGYITSLAFNTSSLGGTTYDYDNVNIRLGCTAAGSITTWQGGLTTVSTFSNFNPVLGWNTFTLATPYAWDGTSNLIVEFCYDQTGYDSYDYVYATNTAFTSVVYYYADNAAGCSFTSTYTSSTRPNIRFNVCPADPTYSWTPAATLTGATTATPVASPVANTTYTVTVDYGTCTATDQVNVNIGGSPPSAIWDGSASSNWFTAANWNTNCVPTCATDVTIPVVATTPQINSGVVAAEARNVTIDAGSRLQIGNGYRLNVCGNYSSYTNLDYLIGGNSGVLAFVGTGAQDFFMSSPGTHDLPSVEVANGNIVNLLSNMPIHPSEGLAFAGAGGRLVTYGFEVNVKNNAPGAITGFGNTGYVQGNLRRAVTGTNAYAFPVGLAPAGLGYQLAEVDFSAPVGGGTSSLRGYFVDYASTSTPAVLFNECSLDFDCVYPSHGKWVIDPNVVGTYTYDVTVYPQNLGTPSCPGAVTTWTVMKRPTGAGAWALQGTPNCPGSPTPASITRLGLTSFSEFGPLGSDVPLPVEFLGLTATPAGDHIALRWEVASEVNTAHYELERSLDASTFAYIGQVPALGFTPSARAYDSQDLDVTTGQRYFYRVKAVDVDGSTRYTNVAEAMLLATGDLEYVMYPNPTNGMLNLTWNSGSAQSVNLQVVDALGKVVVSQSQHLAAGQSSSQLNLAGLSAGVYHVRIVGSGQVQTHRVVKH